MNIKRILIAIDASSHSLAALAAAADLAEKLQAELSGLYIEDINLLRLAKLPFAREFHFSRPQSQKIDAQQMAEQLRLQAALAQRHFDDLAENRNLEHSFRVVQGSIAHELQHAAQETDLLVLGRISRSLLQTTRLGSTAKTAVTLKKQSLFLTHAHADLNQPILLIHDGSDSANRALAVAKVIGGDNGRYNILINTADHLKAQDIKQHLDHYFQINHIKGTFRRLHHANLPEINHVLHMTQSGILMMSYGNEQILPELINDLLNSIECPVFLIK